MSEQVQEPVFNPVAGHGTIDWGVEEHSPESVAGAVAAVGVLRLGAYDVRVVAMDHLDAIDRRVYGEFSSMKQELAIDPSARPTQVFSSFLHELIHAVAWANNAELGTDPEERSVSILADGLAQAFRDNPGFWEWLSCMRAVLGRERT